MKKIYLILYISLSSVCVLAQKPVEAFIGISPGFPMGDLSEYVNSGLGINVAGQTTLKENLIIGGEITFHKLKYEEDYNSFLTGSAFLNYFLKTNSSSRNMPIRPYLGIGFGIYKSRYYDSFFGEDPPTTGVVVSPRGGVRIDFEKLYISGEGRIHLATGYANSYIPLIFSIGFKIK